MVEVFFTDNVIETISVLNQIGRGFEWSGELWGEIVSGLFIINDILLLKQIVSSFGVNSGLDKSERSGLRHQSLYYYSQTGRLEGKKMLGWIHSHDDMSAFLSATDRSQIEDVYLKEIQFLISVVVSSKPKIYRRKRFGLLKKEKKLPFTFKMWFDGKLKGKKFKWDRDKIKPGRNFSFTVLNEDIPEKVSKMIKTDYNKMVEKKVYKPIEKSIRIDRKFLSDYFA
ncbi:MAG: hypothetical protein GPJ54_11920 [Candidatus Heimdallarchaeota archaeon]|nr:hypothetical protein [Candidatus Heimdallarchaeota archaeon]